ncbi:class 1 fructose-bisphosphatase [Echinicola strongylocentroti]|uniref:Fructose-1,6-bisphosphatase class 1 n=1 Tax=Echinicola strongylocentroti TaxID=1795355 RepID=A0A2Z4INP5_9BACT|nr:class 1 fructose-bisphosphatase [Echinicola strongylocentroti]AWW32741.1 class 1 fructose-bisphosphatase [Echinicola strongylocentroti]
MYPPKSNASVNTFTHPLGITVDRFIVQNQHECPEATGELTQVLRDIVLASKIISREINRAGLSGIEGLTDEENVHGEKQRMLDVIAGVRFTRALVSGRQVAAILSEEREGIIDTGNKHAKYVVIIDPLDGSSNIDVNISVGTIFSVYKRISKHGEDFSIEDFLQPGTNQVAAGYVLYGSSTMLVYTTGNGVDGFTYEPSLGEYFLSHPNIVQPEYGDYYSINEKNQESFPDAIREFLARCKKDNMSTRYVGSLVCDFHRNIMKGGVYLYPPTSAYSDGKLRLLYECNALAMISEQANGLATNGNHRILEICPTWHRQRVPFYAGSKSLIEKIRDH